MQIRQNFPIAVSLVLALALTATAQTQVTPDAASLAERHAAWKLEATVSVPGPEAIEALRALLEEAREIAASDAEPEAMRLAEAVIAAAEATLARFQRAADADSRATLASQVGGLTDATLELEIERALERGDNPFLQQVGDFAIPTLRKLALQTSGLPAPSGAISALQALRLRSHEATLDVAVRLLESQNPLVRREAIQEAMCAFRDSRSGVWLPVGELDWRLADPTWEKIAVAAAAEPGLARRDPLGWLLGTFVDHGRLPRELLGSVLALANEGDLILRANVFAPEGLWLFEELFRTGNLEARNLVVAILSSTPFLDLCYDAASDANENMQRNLASSLLLRECRSHADPANRRASNYTNSTYTPDVSPELLAAFKTLALSQFPAVAEAVLKNARQRLDSTGTVPYDGPLLLDLIRRSEPGDPIQMLMGLIAGIPESERVATLGAALEAAAAKMEALESSQLIITTLRDRSSFGIDVHESFWGLANQAAPLLALESQKVRTGLLEVMNTRISTGEIEPAPTLDWLADHGQGFVWDFTNGPPESQVLQAWTTALSPADRYRLVVELAPGVLPENGTSVRVLIKSDYLTYPEQLKAAILDPRSSACVKAECASYLLQKDRASLSDEEASEAARAAMAYAAYAKSAYYEASFLNSLPLAQARAALLSWVEDPKVSDERLLQVTFASQDSEIVDAILKRFPRSSWPSWTLTVDKPYQVYLLRAAARFATRASTTTLHPLLQGDLSDVAVAFEDIAAEICLHRFPVLQSVAESILKQAGAGSEAWQQAVQAVAGYFNEDAAAALLEAAKTTPSAGTRKMAMDALREITEWREASNAWERSLDAGAKRAAAIVELTLLIEDSSQSVEARAASIRGLGLLDAAEELPRLIRALAATEPEIQAAARAALARLEATGDK